MHADSHRAPARRRLLASGLGLTWLVVWLQIFLPFVIPVDPLNPGRHVLGDMVVICTVEGMKVVALDRSPAQEDGQDGNQAGAGTYACPLCSAQALAAALVVPADLAAWSPSAIGLAYRQATLETPRGPPPPRAFAARAPPANA